MTVDLAAEAARIARTDGKRAAWAYVKGWDDAGEAMSHQDEKDDDTS